MKALLFAALILATSLALPVGATSQNPVGSKRVAVKLSVAEIDAKIDVLLAQLDLLTRNGQIQPADFIRVRKLISEWEAAAAPEFPKATKVRAQLAEYVSELEAKFSSALLRYQHVARLKEKFIGSRLDRSLHLLAERARGGGWSEKMYARVSQLLIDRADAAVDSPLASVFRKRLEYILEQAKQRAVTMVVGIFDDFEDELARARMHRTLEILIEDSSNDESTRADFARLMSELVIQTSRFAEK